MDTYTIFVLLRDSIAEERRTEIEKGLKELFENYAAKKLNSFEFQITKEAETIEDMPLWRAFRNITLDDCYWAFHRGSDNKVTICGDLQPGDTLNIGYKDHHKDTPLQYIRESLTDDLHKKRGSVLNL